MNATGVTWKNYQEDVQLSSGPTHSASGTSTTTINPYYSTGQYAYGAKHNPMAFFTDSASQNVNNFGQLRTAITADIGPSAINTFGQYNWITPNLYDDMHSGLSTTFQYHGTNYTPGTTNQLVAQGDNFLSIIIPELMATQAYQDGGAIVIWMDESEDGDGIHNTIPEIVISPLAKGNAYASSVEMNHSSDVKTMEEIFQLGSYINNTIPTSETNASGVGYNNVPTVNDLSDLFVSGAIPSSPVPEPASLGLLALGALCIYSFRRPRTSKRG